MYPPGEHESSTQLLYHTLWQCPSSLPVRRPSSLQAGLPHHHHHNVLLLAKPKYVYGLCGGGSGSPCNVFSNAVEPHSVMC